MYVVMNTNKMIYKQGKLFKFHLTNLIKEIISMFVWSFGYFLIQKCKFHLPLTSLLEGAWQDCEFWEHRIFYQAAWAISKYTFQVVSLLQYKDLDCCHFTWSVFIHITYKYHISSVHYLNLVTPIIQVLLHLLEEVSVFVKLKNKSDGDLNICDSGLNSKLWAIFSFVYFHL